MWKDPIVDEVRAEREKHAEKFDFDLERIFEDLRRQEKLSGRKVVTQPPKVVKRKSA